MKFSAQKNRFTFAFLSERPCRLAKPFLIDILSFVKTRISQILSNKPDWQYVVGKVCHKVAVGAMSGCHKEKWNGMSSTVVA